MELIITGPGEDVLRERIMKNAGREKLLWRRINLAMIMRERELDCLCESGVIKLKL